MRIEDHAVYFRGIGGEVSITSTSVGDFMVIEISSEDSGEFLYNIESASFMAGTLLGCIDGCVRCNYKHPITIETLGDASKWSAYHLICVSDTSGNELHMDTIIQGGEKFVRIRIGGDLVFTTEKAYMVAHALVVFVRECAKYNTGIFSPGWIYDTFKEYSAFVEGCELAL